MSQAERDRVETLIDKEGLSVMNNFVLRLSRDGDLATTEILASSLATLDIHNHRHIAFYLGIIDIPWGEVFDGEIRKHQDPRYPNSELFLNQTPREFFNTVDGVLDILCYDREEIARLYGNIGRQQEFYMWLKPAFLKLIEMGYTPKDLTS